MIPGMKFELKKHVITRHNFIIMLILTVAGIGVLFWNERGYFLNKEQQQQFYEQVGQVFTEEDKQNYIEEKEKLQQEIYKTGADGVLTPDKAEMMKQGKYADTKIEDYALLDELLECMDVVEKRNQNTNLVSNNFSGTVFDYEKENNHMLADRKKLTAVVHNMSFGLLPCIACIIILCSSFAVEYEKNIYPVLCITKRGYWTVCVAKILTGISAAIILNLYFWGIYIVSQFSILGMTGKDWECSLFLADGYQMCASGYTIRDFLIRQILVSLLISVLVTMLTLLLSKLMKKSIYSALASLGLFVIAIFPDILNDAIYSNSYVSEMSNWYIVSQPTFYRILSYEKMLNPMSMIQFGYYAVQPRYIEFLGNHYAMYYFPVLIAVILISIFSIVLFNEKKRGL